MHFYLYEIKNTTNGMIYVGVHKTKNLNDGYMGSGKIIRQAIAKSGKENFSKTILEYFEDEASMREAERHYVNAEFLQRTDVYNIVLGGGCGWRYVNDLGIPKKPRSEEHKAKQSKRMLENYPEALREAVRRGAKKPKSEEQKRKVSEAMKGRKCKPRSEETIKRMSESAKRRWAKK
jgi:group I intron endonuclease